MAQELRLQSFIKLRFTLYRNMKWKRETVERVLSNFNNHFKLDNLKVRELSNVKQHPSSPLPAGSSTRITEAKLILEKLVRSPTPLTT